MTKALTAKQNAIVEICHVIAFYADRLALMRHQYENKDELARRYLSADAKGLAYQTVSPWYLLLEPLYAELEMRILDIGEEEAAFLLAHERVQPYLARLHQIRAAYEFDKEMEAATGLLGREDAEEALAEILQHQSYWTLIPPVLDALQQARNIAVVGSGPLPLTPLALVERTSARITCFELDQTAFDLGNQILALHPKSNRVTSVNQLAEADRDFAAFDAVFSAVLLGVNLDSPTHIPKSQTVQGFLHALPCGAPVILREPFRLGGLLYPSVDVACLTAFDVARFDPDARPGEPYRSSFLILRSLSSNG